MNAYIPSCLEAAAARAKANAPAAAQLVSRGSSGPAFSQTLEQARERARALLASIPPVTGSASGLAPSGSNRLALIRGCDQTNPAEYENLGQARTWGPATCSCAALTAVLRANGSSARIVDVLKVMNGGVTPQLGLISRPALVAAAQRFGLQASDDVTSYQGIQQAVSQGQAVMLDVTSSRFPEGHWLTVTGADANGVTVADSSGYHLTSISRGELLASWSGRGIRVNSPTAAAVASIGGR